VTDVEVIIKKFFPKFVKYCKSN